MPISGLNAFMHNYVYESSCYYMVRHPWYRRNPSGRLWVRRSYYFIMSDLLVNPNSMNSGEHIIYKRKVGGKMSPHQYEVVNNVSCFCLYFSRIFRICDEIRLFKFIFWSVSLNESNVVLLIGVDLRKLALFICLWRFYNVRIYKSNKGKKLKSQGFRYQKRCISVILDFT